MIKNENFSIGNDYCVLIIYHQLAANWDGRTLRFIDTLAFHGWEKPSCDNSHHLANPLSANLGLDRLRSATACLIYELIRIDGNLFRVSQTIYF